MANFCTKCGKKLEKDEVCTCEKIKKEDKKVSNDNNIISEIKEFILSPYDTLKNSDKYKNNSYLILLLTAISSGLLSGSYIFFRIYPITIMVISCIVLFLFTLIFHLVTVSDEFSNTTSIVSISSIYLFVGNILAFFLNFVSYRVSFTVIACSIVLFIINIYQGITLDRKSDKNLNGYLLIISILLTMLITSAIIDIF